MALQNENFRRKQFLTALGLFLSPVFLRLHVNGDSVTGLSSSSSYFLFQQPTFARDCYEALISCSSTHNASGVYIIKPDGYPEPFEIYCDNDYHIGGWTVLQRRSMGNINFNRTWEELKNGFGFLGGEFWLGNDKVAYLTNQKKYQLRIDFQNSEGHSYYVTHDNFKISDEYGEYSLSSLGSHSGTADLYIEWCPLNTVFSYQTCERSCDDPETCIFDSEKWKCGCVGNYKIHERNCIPDNQCGCFITEIGNVLPNGDLYINSDCTRRFTCTNNQLVDESYRCSDYASCVLRNGVRRCYCNEGYEGDGLTCPPIGPKDCYELYLDGTRSDGVYTIYPNGYPGGVQVLCEMERNGGGWTVFQRRTDASLDFYRDWSEYKNGFGNPNHDHWLGNDHIHAISSQKVYQLRIDITDSESSPYYALYSSFNISNEADKYRLFVGSYSGNTGYNALSYSNNQQFSTRDQDNDGWSSYDCAERHRGAWWFYEGWTCDPSYSASDCRNHCITDNSDWCTLFPDGNENCVFCTRCHLNGDYDDPTRGSNIFWNRLSGRGCGITYADMKLRPV